MIAAVFRRLVLGLVVGAMFATAAAVTVVAAAFALYALLEPSLGRAGAAAVLAGGTAFVMFMAGLIMLLGSRPRTVARPERVAASPTLDSTILRAFDYLRERPLVAIAIAAGAGFLAIRNPTYLGSVLRSMLEGGEPPGKPDARR